MNGQCFVHVICNIGRQFSYLESRLLDNRSSDVHIVNGDWSSLGSWERCSLICCGGLQSRECSCTNVNLHSFIDINV